MQTNMKIFGYAVAYTGSTQSGLNSIIGETIEEAQSVLIVARKQFPITYKEAKILALCELPE